MRPEKPNDQSDDFDRLRGGLGEPDGETLTMSGDERSKVMAAS